MRKVLLPLLISVTYGIGDNVYLGDSFNSTIQSLKRSIIESSQKIELEME